MLDQLQNLVGVADLVMWARPHWGVLNFPIEYAVFNFCLPFLFVLLLHQGEQRKIQQAFVCSIDNIILFQVFRKPDV